MGPPDLYKMNRWIPYNGDYEKQFYNIRLKDGRVLKCCWPNAGMWFVLNGAMIKSDQVTHVQICADPQV